MIRVGQKLFKERALLINKQLALAKDLNNCFNMNSVQKNNRNYNQLYIYQDKITNIEKNISKLVEEYKITKI